MGGCGEAMTWFRVLGHGRQWTICGLTIAFLKEGVWWRLEQWKNQGYWLTWSIKQRFSERNGYESPIRQIGKGKRLRVAIFFLDQPGWDIVKNLKENRNIRRVK